MISPSVDPVGTAGTLFVLVVGLAVGRVLSSPLVDAKIFFKLLPDMSEEEKEDAGVPIEVGHGTEVVRASSMLLTGRLDGELMARRATGVLELVGRMSGLIATCT
jgi:hypothetical protein